MFECPNCQNLYKWKKSMLAHLRYQCKQPPRFECLHCQIKNYQKTHIIRHLRVHHSDLTPMFFDRKLNTLCRSRWGSRLDTIIVSNKRCSWISMCGLFVKNLNVLWYDRQFSTLIYFIFMMLRNMINQIFN
jgi:hypothetical protein